MDSADKQTQLAPYRHKFRKEQDSFAIDLGCGQVKEYGAVGLDNVSLPSVDVVHDLLDFPYPFSDGVANTIYLKHVIEHFRLDDVQQILTEVNRLLMDDGRLYIRVPHVFCIAAWTDPTHRMSFTFDSIRFFDAASAKAYYRETEAVWDVESISASVTLFNWKRYRLRRVDAAVSKLLGKLMNQMLKWETWPGAADLLVKALPIFFVEIRWTLKKHRASEADLP